MQASPRLSLTQILKQPYCSSKFMLDFCAQHPTYAGSVSGGTLQVDEEFLLWLGGASCNSLRKTPLKLRNLKPRHDRLLTNPRSRYQETKLQLLKG